MSNQESKKPLLASDLSPKNNHHHHALLLRQQQNQNPFYLENQNLEEAFSRFSLMPQNQNHHHNTPMNNNHGGQASNNGYPLAPNTPLSDVGLMEQQGGISSNNNNNNNIVFLQQQRMPWFDNGFEYVSSSSGTVPSMPLSPQSYYEDISRLRANLIAAAYQREYQRLLPTSQLSGNNEFLVFGGRPSGDHRDLGVILNHEANLINNNNNKRRNNNNNVSGRRHHNHNHHHHQHQQQQPLTSNHHRSVFELRGKIMALAKDQCGCRVLQDTMKELTTKEEVSIVFEELIDHVVELIPDPCGNYVFQRLVEICSVEQITRIVLMVTKNAFQLVNFCLDNHGTRAVQGLLEYVTNQEQRSLIMSALSPNAVVLSKDTNGLHVVEHCVKKFKKKDTMYLMNVVGDNCFEVATDKSGCCVMQLCIDHAEGETREKVVAEIIVNAPLLSEDCYGNYVVQHLIAKQNPIVTESIMRQLEGRFFTLSCNKYGSNVVEKLFQESGEQHSERIILELLHHPHASMLVVDPYANYVISSAVSVSKGPIRKMLMELVKRNYRIMRSNHYGKKLLGRLRATMSTMSRVFHM